MLAELTDDEAATLEHDWQFWARPSQQPPAGSWRVWLLMAGRGFGKTRTGAEWIHGEVTAGRRGRLALIAPTAADVRDVMVEGESGLLATAAPGFRPTYEPSKRRLTWPNGAIATTYSADEPERLRGPQHDGGWADEIGAWRRPEAWDMFMFGLRLGDDPRAVATTTPRPIGLIRDLLAQVEAGRVAVTRGTTYENAANLAPQFMTDIITKYQGTRLGRQELGGELLTDVPGALWTLATIDAHRVAVAPDLVRIVIAIDPAATAHDGSDETGIIVAGRGADGDGYVLADRSCKASPLGWAQRAIQAYTDFEADRIVAEANNGGDMVMQTIRGVDARAPVTLVRATRDKRTRADPIAALAEQGRIHHVGSLPALEDQLTSWTPDSGTSPDRLDALVWAITELMPTRPKWGAV